MARIAFGTYMVRYPMGGNMSAFFQWILGLERLNHEVFVVEKCGYANSCFDPIRGVMTDDCTIGFRTVRGLLERYGMHGRLCYVDAAGSYHGLSRTEVEDVFATADLFLDVGSHGGWLPEAEVTPLRVVVDQEPGYRQIKWQLAQANGIAPPSYDRYYSNGINIGTEHSTAPTVGIDWGHVVNAVVIDFFESQVGRCVAPFTTVMNWQAHEAIEYGGFTYGQKDVEFAKFITLPALVSSRFEVAVSGNIPEAKLSASGWRIRSAHEVTRTIESYLGYIRYSAGEFSVAKNVFVETRSGWFSDRSAAYLASGRPVVVQETGFSRYLPTGRGLFAVRTVEEAAEAIERVTSDYDRHAQWATELAHDYFDTRTVLPRFMHELGL
jgi:hypothetical protein